MKTCYPFVPGYAITECKKSEAKDERFKHCPCDKHGFCTGFTARNVANVQKLSDFSRNFFPRKRPLIIMAGIGHEYYATFGKGEKTNKRNFFTGSSWYHLWHEQFREKGRFGRRPVKANDLSASSMTSFANSTTPTSTLFFL